MTAARRGGESFIVNSCIAIRFPGRLSGRQPLSLRSSSVALTARPASPEIGHAMRRATLTRRCPTAARRCLAAAICLLFLAVGCARLDNLYDNPKGWAGRRVCLRGRSCGPPGPHFGTSDWLEVSEPQTYELLVADGSSAERIEVVTSGPLPREGVRVWVHGIVRTRAYTISPFEGEPYTVDFPGIQDTPEMKAVYAAIKFCALAVRGSVHRRHRDSARNSLPRPSRH
jgi:hypothetical protein